MIYLQRFSTFDLARPGDKRVLDSAGEATEEFVDPLRVQFRNVVEVCCNQLCWFLTKEHSCFPGC
jgi:hypothetical protein